MKKKLLPLGDEVTQITVINKSDLERETGHLISDSHASIKKDVQMLKKI